MKAFKKVLALLLVLSLVFVMTACGDSDDDDNKKGESRKPASSSQGKDEDPTPTADPTDEPTPVPTDDPTPTAEPTAEPTSEPTPVPTQNPGPVNGDPVSFNDIKGLWKCDLTLDMNQFAEFYDDADTAQVFGIFTDFGYSPVLKLHMELNFENEEDATMSYTMDGSEIGKAMKEMFSTEEGILKFYGSVMGMDAESIKGILAMSGMTVADLAKQLDVDELMGELQQTDEKDFSYEIKDKEIILSDDAEVTLVYDASANVLRFKVNPSSTEADQILAVFGNSVLTR